MSPLVFLKTFPVRTALFLMVGAVVVIFGCAYFLVIFWDLIPCPLCIAQRVFYFLIGITALLEAIGFFKRQTLRLTAWLIMVFALLGGAIAARQTWMQHFPPENLDPTRCGVSFGSFFDSFLKALGGAGNCALVDWKFIFSIAEWSLLLFIGFFFAGLWLLWRAKHPSVVS